MEWNAERLKAFKKAYTQAVKEDQQSFYFLGLEFVQGYAKYLIEYLESKLS